MQEEHWVEWTTKVKLSSVFIAVVVIIIVVIMIVVVVVLVTLSQNE